MADLADRLAAELCAAWDIGLFWAQEGWTDAKPDEVADVIRGFLVGDANRAAEGLIPVAKPPTNARAGAETGAGRPE